MDAMMEDMNVMKENKIKLDKPIKKSYIIRVREKRV